MGRLHVSDLVQIVPAAARLEAVGGPNAARIRTGIIELLAESCDVATLAGARQRLQQQVGEREEIRDAETRLVDDAIRHAAALAATQRRLSIAPDAHADIDERVMLEGALELQQPHAIGA